MSEPETTLHSETAVLMLPLILPAWLGVLFTCVLTLPFPCFWTLTLWLFVAAGIGMIWRGDWSFWLMGGVSLYWITQIIIVSRETDWDPQMPGLVHRFPVASAWFGVYLALIVLLCVWNLFRNYRARKPASAPLG